MRGLFRKLLYVSVAVSINVKLIKIKLCFYVMDKTRCGGVY